MCSVNNIENHNTNKQTNKQTKKQPFWPFRLEFKDPKGVIRIGYLKNRQHKRKRTTGQTLIYKT